MTKKQLGLSEENPTRWFENIYSNSNIEGESVPWANMSLHPKLREWLQEHSLDGTGLSALVVGCGMGDDAIALENLGFKVTAFDVSVSAVKLCRERFSESKVNFMQADLLKDIPKWKERFDFVLEIYTIQALPPKYEDLAIKHICGTVEFGGSLLVVTAVQCQKRDFKVGPPWLLNSNYLEKIEGSGLELIEKKVSDGSAVDTEINTSLFMKK